MTAPELRRVSASRLKTLDDCTMLFYLSEILRLPQRVWPRTLIGTIVHSVLECLYREKHRKHHDTIKAAGTIAAVPAVTRLVRAWQVKHAISDALIADVDAMVVLVLTQTDFLDEGAVTRFQPEHEFRMILKNGAVVKGFLDRFAIFAAAARITDYKSQKNKFTREEVAESFQSLVYQLYAWKEYGVLAEVCYILLRHPPTPRAPGKHLQVTPPATPTVLAGFESYLEHMFEVINNFGVEEAGSKLHSDAGFCRNVCSYFRPLDYLSLRKKTGELVGNFALDKSPQVGQDEILTTEHHNGCPKWN